MFNPVLAIRYETTADQLRYLLAEIRRLFYEHPKVETETAQASASPISITSALRLEITSYVLTPRLERISPRSAKTCCCASCEIVGAIGHRLCLPSRRPVYFSRDHGLDKEKAAAAEKQVQQWRDQHQLPFPDFAPADKSSFRGSIALSSA